MKQSTTLVQDLLNSGWKDRNIIPLPNEECKMTILTNEGEVSGKWIPYPMTEIKPYPGYLGSVYVKTEITTIGFHAWKQNNSEFQYYKIIDE